MAAAVVTSIAAFVAGCGLPVVGSDKKWSPLRDQVDRSRREDQYEGTRDVAREREVWCSETEALSVSIATASAQTKSLAVLAAEEDDESMSYTPNKDLPVMGIYKPSRKNSGWKFGKTSRKSGAHVQFDLSMLTEHEITPYSEVYGRHPRSFHFGRGRSQHVKRQPQDAWRFVDPSDSDDSPTNSQTDDEDTDEDEKGTMMSNRLRGFLTLNTLSWRFWMIACLCCFLLRAFGEQIFEDHFPSPAASGTPFLTPVSGPSASAAGGMVGGF